MINISQCYNILAGQAAHIRCAHASGTNSGYIHRIAGSLVARATQYVAGDDHKRGGGSSCPLQKIAARYMSAFARLFFHYWLVKF